MNKLLDPIQKLLRIENQNMLNNLESKKDFLQDFKLFLKNSDEKSQYIDRSKLKKIKNVIETNHNSIFENNKFPEFQNSNKNNDNFLNKLNGKALNDKNFLSNNNNKQDFNNSNSHNNPNNNFVVLSKNSKNKKNLKLFEEIKKQETKNEFYDSINIINTNTNANTTKSLGLNYLYDFNNDNKNTFSNLGYKNTKDSVNKTYLQTIQNIIKNEKLKQEIKFENLSKERQGRNKKQNDLKNILTNESIVESIKNEIQKAFLAPEEKRQHKIKKAENF